MEAWYAIPAFRSGYGRKADTVRLYQENSPEEGIHDSAGIDTVGWNRCQGAGGADGRYRYSLIVWDERDNISAARTGVAHVDTTPPSVELKIDDLLFSPNGDRKKDSLAVTQDIVTAPDDEWRADSGTRRKHRETIRMERRRGSPENFMERRNR